MTNIACKILADVESNRNNAQRNMETVKIKHTIICNLYRGVATIEATEAAASPKNYY